MNSVRLADIFDLQMGKTPSRNNPVLWGEGNKWLSIADLGKCEKYTADTKERITDEGVRTSGIKVVPKGTIVMSFKLSIGKTAITTEDIYTNEAIMAFHDKHIHDVDVDYIYHLFSGKDWSAGTNKAVMGATLNKATLSDVVISLPDLPTQRRIATTLDKVSEGIAVCRQMLADLDLLVKARFVELFGASEEELTRWNQEPLGNICKQVKRYPTFCNMEYLDSGVRVIRIGNILHDGHMDLDDNNYVFVYEKANDDFPDTVIERNDVIMAVRGDGSAASRIGIVTEDQLIGSNISPNLIRMQVDQKKIYPLFFFYYLTGEIGQKRLDAYVNKTAKKNIAAKDIVKVLTPVPPLSVQQEFVSLVEQVDKSKVVVQQQLAELEMLKNSLMQKYFG